MSKTFGWFSYGLLSTAASVYYMRNSLLWAAVPWWGFLGGMMVCGLAAYSFDYFTQLPLKVLAYTSMTWLMGLTIVPLI